VVFLLDEVEELDDDKVLLLFDLCRLLLECCWLNTRLTCLCAIVVIRLSNFGAETGSSSFRRLCVCFVEVVICCTLYWAFSCTLVDC